VVLKDKAKNNSILIVSGTNNDWVRSNKDSNKNVKQIIDNCNGNYYGLNLKIDEPGDDEDDKSKNAKKRKTSIDEFMTFLDSKSFNKLNLDHVQSAEFENEWQTQVIPNLVALMAAMALGPELAFAAAMTQTPFMKKKVAEFTKSCTQM
jgi:hypothetical protein